MNTIYRTPDKKMLSIIFLDKKNKKIKYVYLSAGK